MIIPFEILIDPTVPTNIFLSDLADIDILDIGSRSLPLCCPLCRHVGPFSRRTTRQSKLSVRREFQCPACACIIALTISIKSIAFDGAGASRQSSFRLTPL